MQKIQKLREQSLKDDFSNPIRTMKIEDDVLCVASHGEGTYSQHVYLYCRVLELISILKCTRIVYSKGFKNQLSLIVLSKLIRQMAKFATEASAIEPVYIALCDNNKRRVSKNRMLSVFCNTLGLNMRYFNSFEEAYDWVKNVNPTKATQNDT